MELKQTQSTRFKLLRNIIVALDTVKSNLICYDQITPSACKMFTTGRGNLYGQCCRAIKTADKELKRISHQEVESGT